MRDLGGNGSRGEKSDERQTHRSNERNMTLLSLQTSDCMSRSSSVAVYFLPATGITRVPGSRERGE